MNLSQHHGPSKCLIMDLEEAFALQAALTEIIRRASKTMTSAALRGVPVTSTSAAETVQVAFTFEQDKKTYPSSLTLAILEGIDAP